MRRLCEMLGLPQNRFASIHVVGTNGKTSVSRMTSALLEAHGARTGTYLSPHVARWSERIRIGGKEIAQGDFARAVERAAEAAAIAERAFEEGERVTQFELCTAAAFLAFAGAGVKVAVIEAGLGGRLDATNVIPSTVTVLTSVGLDHTEWLGGSIGEIAAEKLAVLRDHATLVAGRVPGEAERVLERTVEERHARLIRVPEEPPPVLAEFVSGYQRRNLAIACSATDAFLGRFDPGAAVAAGERLSVPGRAEYTEGDPPELFDAAHNVDGARALADSLGELAGRRPVIACLALLSEKDAAGIVEVLAPACHTVVCTEFPAEALQGAGRPGAEARPAAELAELCRQLGVAHETETDPQTAWRRARELAGELGGVALAVGSHYLLRTVWTERRARSF